MSPETWVLLIGCLGLGPFKILGLFCWFLAPHRFLVLSPHSILGQPFVLRFFDQTLDISTCFAAFLTIHG